ncbi:MAG TPA: flagellar hook protein FlgE [Acetobacteraceae bacterium]|nr:flagellar hook protein FlgE [Acetobacteraceae bacterium]
MSLLGAMNTAISGLTAQSTAFGNISDNVANSQTTGYKEVDTNFVDYLTTSTATVNDPGAVVAQPDYLNNVQGTITQVNNPLALAIAGQGFFAVSQETGQVNGTPTFNPQQFYSRAGDFTLNSSGYLVNSAGEYLNGWSVDSSTGIVNQNSLAPIQVSQSVYNPVATSQVTLSANLPATPASGTATSSSPISSDIDVYDSLGTEHTITLNWVQTSPNNWTVQINCPDAATPDCGTADVTFGPSAAGDATAPSGTIGNLVTDATDPGSVTVSAASAGSAATVSFDADFGNGNQAITLNVGNYGAANGLTQYAGTQYNLEGLTQNGVPPGSYSGVTPQANGDIVVNYNNGQTRTIAQVPLITFNNPDALQRQDGQSFTTTLGSGTPLAEQASTNGAGNLVVGSVESSNVDIATEFSNLIVAQQAYSANAKMVTTAQQMLETTVDMKQ